MGNEVYETDQLVSDYLLFHYLEAKRFMPWSFAPSDALDFPVRTARYAEGKVYNRILDLGCGVGRASFELAAYAQSVLGVDFSHAFADTAQSLAKGSSISLKRESGVYEISAPPIREGVEVSFKQGDAMDFQIQKTWGKFDLIHAANLLCRLPDPTLFLEKLPDLLNNGAKVILATPFSWLDEFTAVERQPVGDSWEWLKLIMADKFELETEADEPFMIREHVRKYQWCVSKVSVWNLK